MAGFVVAVALLAGCGEEPVAAASGAPSQGAAPNVLPLPVGSGLSDVDAGFVERARLLAADCAWSEDKGFDDKCKPLDALLAVKLQPVAAFATGELLLADAKPAVRSVGLSLLQGTLSPSQGEAAPLGTALALIKAAQSETVPALDFRLAMAAAQLEKKSDALQKPLETLVRTIPAASRVVALMSIMRGVDDPPWVLALVMEALKDKDPEIRKAALTGLVSGRFQSHRAETCKLLAESLADADIEVRSAARRSIIANLDVVIDDPKRGLIGMRMWPTVKQCDEPEIEAAYTSLEKDVREKTLSLDARALFHAGALRRGPFHGPKLEGRNKERRDLAVSELTEIAKDTKAPQSARLTAIRGLRMKAAGDNSTLFAALAKDIDALVAKAASAPSN